MVAIRNAYNILVGKPQGTRPLGRRKWKEDFRMDLRVKGWKVVNWM
jgi:hypothetical protein